MNGFYMVEVYLPLEISDDFMRMIPSHRTYISKLINDGLIFSYSVNKERTKGWILFNAASAAKVHEIVLQFPIHQFIDFNIHELFIQDGEMFRFPKMLMN